MHSDSKCSVAEQLKASVEHLLEWPLPLRLRARDGSEAGPAEGPVMVVRDRRALRRFLWRPGELGLARAWVAGDVDVEGDLYDTLARLAAPLLAHRTNDSSRRGLGGVLATLRTPEARSALRALVRLAGLLPRPAAPAEEMRGTRRGHRHTKRSDRRVISHHYDVGNGFYELVLGPSMVYSCAYWGPDGGGSLEEAQRDKLDLVCRKLDLRRGQRLLDVGCGWGSMALHAAREHGVRVVGVTLSEEQAAYAAKRVADAGLTGEVEIRVQDYRDVDDGPYDAVSSIGMAEHVGSARYLAYARHLYNLLAPGGRLLNHQISRRPLNDEVPYRPDRFIASYVFPDGELAPVGTTAALLEQAGFEVRDVESLREHYTETLRRWVGNLEADWAHAVQLVGPARARIWRLYMAACALSFAHNRIGVNQMLAVRTTDAGASGLPWRTRSWLAAEGGPTAD